MSTILDRIAAHKAVERAALRAALDGAQPGDPSVPDEATLDRVRLFLGMGCADRAIRPFSAALRGSSLSVIAEIKRASPSAGRFADWVDPEPLAEAYARGGASACSVLTDVRFFEGHPSFLPRVRAVFPGPVLRKDFLEEELDLALAAALGADAALLIVSRLGRRTASMLRACEHYALEALVEVHDEDELEMALEAGAPVIGVNNRDLDTFVTDLGTTERLAKLLPDTVTLVGESGIRGPADARRMRDAGCHAVLVGQSLAQAGGAGLRALQVG